MSTWKFITHLTLIWFLCEQVGFASPQQQDDSSLYGTHSVFFQPGVSSGNMFACTLVYRAVQVDYAYRDGNAILVVGSFGVLLNDGNLILTLKIGTKDVMPIDDSFTSPYFAYLKTQNATTAKSVYVANDNGEGYRLISIQLDGDSSEMFLEMLDSGKVTIGFNRRENGLDVLVPIDLQVSDAKVLNSGEVVRERSRDAITQFGGCFWELVSQAKLSLN